MWSPTRRTPATKLCSAFTAPQASRCRWHGACAWSQAQAHACQPACMDWLLAKDSWLSALLVLPPTLYCHRPSYLQR
jgi:hypothetical protein